jgi:hypothetical protein
VRVDANPVAQPRQNGEFADTASSSGRCARMRFMSRIAAAGVGTPMCTCVASVGSRSASPRIEEAMWL